MTDYIPVDCDFHDELEALATLRQVCQITYRNADNQVVDVQGQIVDIYTADRAEFLKLKNGTEIRLDQIVSVNGKPASSCSN